MAAGLQGSGGLGKDPPRVGVMGEGRLVGERGREAPGRVPEGVEGVVGILWEGTLKMWTQGWGVGRTHPGKRR